MPDLILKAGTVITMDPDQPRAEAVAVANGRITAVGSIAPGKLADFNELAADPHAVDPVTLAEKATVQGTWLSGERIDLDAFLGAVHGTDASEHAHLAARSTQRGCC